MGQLVQGFVLVQAKTKVHGRRGLGAHHAHHGVRHGALVVFVHGQLNEAAVAFVLGIRKRRTPLAAFALGYQQLRSRQIAVRAKR